MTVDVFYEDSIRVTVSWLPAWEMFFSMHVLAAPEHHPTRREWAKIQERREPELTGEIRELKEITNCWEFIIDSKKWSQVRQMEIPELLLLLKKLNIYQWNEWIVYSGKTMTREERDRVLKVMEAYYSRIFQKEELILRPYLVKLLQKEKEKCVKKGLWRWCRGVHERLLVGAESITYRKNRDYIIPKEDIRECYLTVSTFLAPHLWYYRQGQELEIVKGILKGDGDEDIPRDYLLIFKALGDHTRLKIIKHLLHGICTTRELSQALGISEAAVSRHLKVLGEAGLVKKERKGIWTEYQFVTDTVDYIPYLFYETMLQ